MRLSYLLRISSHAFGLLSVALLAFSLASPAGAEPGSKPPSAPNGGTPPSAEAKPSPAAEQSKSDPAAAEPKSNAAGQPKSNSTAAPQEGETAGDGSQVLINVDKSRQEVTIFVDGIEKYTWPVSTGRRGYSTPSGTYAATSMNEIWYSKEWDNAPMPHAIFFMKDGHAIHGSFEVKTLGKPVSHGCVRISPANAVLLYALVKEKGLKNTQVVLTGVTPGGEEKVAAQPAYPRDADADAGPWPGQGYYGPGAGQGYYPPRRGFFGRWFQPDNGPQGDYRPRGYQRGY
jgi:lipoprotein-anchoring transpeptidase ErfK/SrfK